MHSPVFLIGTQRSGTTLLTRMMSAHSEIFIKNEVPMLQVFKPGATREEIEAAIDENVKFRHGKSIKDLLESEGKSVWGLKDPQLTEHLDALKLFLPEARFVIIVRDARAVVRSYIENAWGLGTNAYTGALRWDREVKQQLAFLKELPDTAMLLKYEDLVLKQRESLEKICSFIDVPFDEAMMNYANEKAFVAVNRQSVNTFKAPDPSIVTKWKQKLTPHEIKTINMVCHETLSEFGYEVEEKYENLNPLMTLYYKLHQAIVGEFQIQYRWRIGGYKRKMKAKFSKKSNA